MQAKKSLVLIFILCSLQVADAQIKQINLLDKGGNIIEQVSYNPNIGTEAGKASERMKAFWFCWSKKFFSNLSCDFVDRNINNAVANNVFSQQVPVQPIPTVSTQTSSPEVQIPAKQPIVSNQPPAVSNQQSVNGSQIIYQVIERAVPGPQGPAGPAGKDGQNGASGGTQFLTQYIEGAEYDGFGITPSTSPNPTGDADLSTIVGVGLTSCNSTTSKLTYNDTTKQFECAADQGAGGLTAMPENATFTLATVTSATTTNLFVSNASLTFATATNMFANTISNTSFNSSNSTITNSTSTNLFATVFSALAATITNFLFTNATGTNATTTNLATSYFNATGYSYIPNLFGGLATFTSATGTNIFGVNIFNTNLTSTGTFVLATGTIASTTASNANVTNLFATNFLNTLATLTSATSTNLYSANATFTSLNAQQATFSYATVTNGFFTNLSVTGPVQAALANGYIFRGGSSNISEATSSVFVSDSSYVGIGSTTPSEKLSVQGNLLVSGNIVSPKFTGLSDTDGSELILCMTAAGELRKDVSQNCFLTYSSDERLKKNIVPIANTLEKVRQLKTVNFNWIDEKRGTSTQIGYIAQDVEKVFPEAVKKDADGYLKVNYVFLSSIYANAIKELDKLVFENINAILDRLTKNEEEILNLKTRVSNLESALNISVPVVPEQPASEPAILPQDQAALPQEAAPQEETPVSGSEVEPVLPQVETAAASSTDN